ncbi:hypothetical protein Psuf_021320 [Phytohabitans suffuscus]|uniref:SMP-30/Gluconolactonase/LRE-like region domain-containing protein n=1 Tax=Phytohabitans suffuscus TaxID=624315 RepID=A0A6F8YFM9_9ACTN|nr:YncE family protein [Phytohabitans suffuscus]BCB84819.1 hypothetical protein Psuf_021320 [Phytohabitans suffuscus]
MQRKDLGDGQYQIAYSARNDVFWVTQAGPPPVTTSRLLRVDPDTLEILNSYWVPWDEPTSTVEAVFGLDVDDTHNTVWATSTRLNRVAVYDQATGAHLKSFDNVNHGREVEVDEERGTVYVSAVNGRYIATFDAETLERGPDIPVDGQPMGLDLDEAAGKLYTSTLDTDKLAVVDVASRQVTYHALPGADRSSNVAVFPQRDRVYAANQDSADVTVLDAGTGAHVASIPTGNGALALDVDPETGLLYVANFFAHTISVIDTATNTVVHTVEDTAVSPNDVEVVDGAAYVVDKATFGGGAHDGITKIVPTEVPDPGDPGDPGEPGQTEGAITVRAQVPDGLTGRLTLTVDPGAAVTLQPQEALDRVAFTGAIPAVTVVDARSTEAAAGGGWAVSAQSGPFTSSAGQVGADHLGWAPKVLTPRDGVTAGPAVAGLLAGGPGLGSAATMATANNAGRVGSTRVGADLTLAVPLDTDPGAYTATLTVSLFPTD